MITRIVRGYTFISRNYEAGDAIVVVGFSRGAYTARALAGLIASQGVLAKHLTTDKTDAYRRGSQAWYLHRKQSTSSKPGFLQKLVEATADFPGFLSRDDLDDSDLMPVDKIKAVAVWDTVGALGLPRYFEDKRGAGSIRAAQPAVKLTSRGNSVSATRYQKMIAVDNEGPIPENRNRGGVARAITPTSSLLRIATSSVAHKCRPL